VVDVRQNRRMLFADIVSTGAQVGATSSRTAKRDAIAALLRSLAPDEIAVAVAYLSGEARQGRIGVGWATVRDLQAPPATAPSLTILDIDRLLDRIEAMTGAGSVGARSSALTDAFERMTEAEQSFLRRLLIGELRQGALEGTVLEGIAAAAAVPATAVRRAYMLSGDLGVAAATALTSGRPGLDAIGLTVLHGVQPMLASTAASVDDALAQGGGAPASVEWKLDGARIQVHRRGDDVRVYTRNLNDITQRLPMVIDTVRSLPVHDVVLDGEVLGFSDIDAARDVPRAFQETMSQFGRGEGDGNTGLRPYFFDVLHVDGHDLIDEPLRGRLATLDEVASAHRIPGIVTTDAVEAQAFLDEALAAGHEGVMVKDIESAYAAGRRGKAWRKVKPVHLLDLVVIAVEWGSGRRQGWLSNLHLGARNPDDGSFVMVGTTFKGMTDELLAWLTEHLLAREIGREGHVVHVRPDLVVEIALDGVQISRRYPGGVALRFARVRRYRADKLAKDADTIERVRALNPALR
jgi:DNA ligase-1